MLQLPPPLLRQHRGGAQNRKYLGLARVLGSSGNERMQQHSYSTIQRYGKQQWVTKLVASHTSTAMVAHRSLTRGYHSHRCYYSVHCASHGLLSLYPPLVRWRSNSGNGEDGRNRKERKDSITDSILMERKSHLERLARAERGDYFDFDDQADVNFESLVGSDFQKDEDGITGDYIDVSGSKVWKPRQKWRDYLRAERLDRVEARAAELEAMGLGSRKRSNKSTRRGKEKLSSGAHRIKKRKSILLTSATKPPWPIFKHMLPEIALAGHSNCGKSTLINSLVGIGPKGVLEKSSRSGPAHVSDRAGWTDALFWIQVSTSAPTLNLVDLPGYGHAVASLTQMRLWQRNTRRYLAERSVLARCCILVDATRGLCDEDIDLLRYMRDEQRPHQIVLTMGDLLSPTQLAWCAEFVDHDMNLLDLQDQHRAERDGGSASRRRDYDKRSMNYRRSASRQDGQPSMAEGAPALSSAQGLSNRGRRPVRGVSIRSHFVPIVSGHTGAGVKELWGDLARCTAAVSAQVGDLPIHLAALK